MSYVISVSSLCHLSFLGQVPSHHSAHSFSPSPVESPILSHEVVKDLSWTWTANRITASVRRCREGSYPIWRVYCLPDYPRNPFQRMLSNPVKLTLKSCVQGWRMFMSKWAALCRPTSGSSQTSLSAQVVTLVILSSPAPAASDNTQPLTSNFMKTKISSVTSPPLIMFNTRSCDKCFVSSFFLVK